MATRSISVDMGKAVCISSVTGINPYQIFSLYLGKHFVLGKMMSAPYRSDSNPSFIVYCTDAHRFIWKDYGTGEGGDCIDLVKILFNLSTIQAIDKIVADLRNAVSVPVPDIRVTKKHKTIEIINQPFTSADYRYWKQFGVSIQLLYDYSVSSVNTAYIEGSVVYKYKYNDPAYAFRINNKFKIYRPLTISKYGKWFCNTTNDDYQGWNQLPNAGDLLILTKSMKDVLVLKTFGYNAIAPQSEQVKVDPVIINSLRDRFSKLVIFFDNDSPGIEAAYKLNQRFNIQSIHIPIEYGAKDPAELRSKCGHKKSVNLINELINEIERRSNYNGEIRRLHGEQV